MFKQIFLFLKKYHRLLIVIVVLVLAVLARTLLLAKTEEFLTYKVTRGELLDTVVATGTYRTAMQKPIVSPTNGVITEVFIDNDSYVHEGDPLLRIKSTATETEKSFAYATYLKALNAHSTSKQAKEELKYQLEQSRQAILDAQAAVDNMEEYLNSGKDNPATNRQYTQEEKESKYSSLTSARQAFAAIEMKYLDANQAISANWASVELTKLEYEATKNTTVHAPVSGKITNLILSVGDEVSANKEPVLIISNDENPSIVLHINEMYIPKINFGQKATVVFDALKDKRFNGEVEAIETIGGTQNGVVDYRVKIRLLDLTAEIKPGMTATVDIEVFRKNDVVFVPQSAVINSDGTDYVLINSGFNGGYKQTSVTTGETTTDKIEITSGLEGKESLILNPLDLEKHE